MKLYIFGGVIQNESGYAMSDILIFIFFIILTFIIIAIYMHNYRNKYSLFLLAAIVSLFGAILMSALWIFLSEKSELFSALCSLIILILTGVFSFIQYSKTIEDKKRSERKDARPEIINPELSYNKWKKEIVLEFMLFSSKEQVVMDINGELFLSFDSKAEEYIHCGHFDNIGTQITGKILEGRVDPFKHKSKYYKMRNFIDGDKIFSKYSGFEYLIYFRTKELENGVAVYLRGTNGYMAYYSDKDEKWYKYDQLDKKISSKQINIINKYKP